MKEEDVINQRAMLGIPAFALMHDRNTIGHKEGFDSNGNFWYQTHSSRMEPAIHKESYLALRPLKSVDNATSYNGETYVFVVWHGGVTDTVIGRVTNNPAKDGIVRVLTLNPKTTIDIGKDLIVETYLVAYALSELPNSMNP